MNAAQVRLAASMLDSGYKASRYIDSDDCDECEPIDHVVVDVEHAGAQYFGLETFCKLFLTDDARMFEVAEWLLDNS